MKLLIFVLIMLVIDSCSLVHKHEVKWRESKMSKMIRQGVYKDFVKQRNALRASPTNLQVKNQDMYDFYDFQYLSQITVGTPAQNFTIVLDTGSANFWIIGNCTPSMCIHKQDFNKYASKTYHDLNMRWEVTYGSGKASGETGNDFLRLGPLGSDSLVVPNTIVGLANWISPEFYDDDTDGILGLGFQSLAVNKVLPPLQNAIQQNLLDQPLFTIYLTHQDSIGKGGQITYGGVDTENCGNDFSYHSLTSATYWQFKMDGVQLGNYNIKTPYQVISDTGTSFIGGPQAVVKAIASAVNAVMDRYQDLFLVDCNKITKNTLDLIIGGITYSIQPKNYILQLDNGDGTNTCILAMFSMQGGGHGPSWILGDPFLRQFCNVHDIGNKRIGFSMKNASTHTMWAALILFIAHWFIKP